MLNDIRTGNQKQQIVFIMVFLVGLYFTSYINYLLFHTLAELFSIVIAFSFFTIAWNAKEHIKNQYILFIGIVYLFIGFIDLLHTFTYKGLPFFPGAHDYATQLWIAARYLESLSLLTAFYFLKKQRIVYPKALFLTYFLITAVIVVCIFYWNVFPVCHQEGVGLTPFKKISEYIICLFLLANIFLLHRRRELFQTRILKIVMLALICTIISELAFTFYISVYGFSNLVGHYFKLFSFCLIYKAIVETGIRQPYDLIFKELTTTNISLNKEIDRRVQIQEEREKLIENLQNALTQVKTLKGLLPICSHCKKIRDDEGYWNNIENYLERYSDAELSHSICQACAKKYYPDYDIYEE